MPAYIRDKRLILSFAYNAAAVEAIKALPARQWDKTNKYWTVPANPYFARAILPICAKYHIEVRPEVKSMADEQIVDHIDFDFNVNGFKPYPFQTQAVTFLESVGGRGLIADDVGTGKSIEVLLYLRYKNIRHFLIVCPASVTYKWEIEIKRWYPEIENVHIVGRKDEGGEVSVTSYGLLTRRLSQIKGPWEAVVLDEGHYISNYKALRTKAVRELCRGISKIIAVTATPIRNRPSELYNLLNILDPVAWNWASYMQRYCYDGVNYQGAKNLKELEYRLRTTMLRRHKRDVMDQMPSLTRTYVPIEVDEVVYQKLYVGDAKTWTKEMGRPAADELSIVNGLKYWTTVEKAKAIIEWAEDFLDSSDEKLVIYAGYHKVIAMLEQALSKYGVTRITGEISQAERSRIIQSWQTTTEHRVMLLTSAGGEGIDLFGKSGINCSTLLFVSREWTPAMEMQIEGRLDRTGQEYPVQIVYPIARSTLDEQINHLIEEKRHLMKETVGIYQPDVSILPDLLSMMRGRNK